MEWNAIIPMLEKYAPTLAATLIGGPVGGIASIAIKSIADVVGAHEDDHPQVIAKKIVESSDAKEKIQEAEKNYQLEIEKIKSQKDSEEHELQMAEIENIEKARDMQGSSLKFVIFGSLIALLVLDVIALCIISDKDAEGVLVSAAAVLLGGLGKAYKFYYPN